MSQSGGEEERAPTVRGPQDEHFDTAQLALDDGEARLPWLESEDDFDEAGGPDAARLLGLMLLGLVLLAAIIGGIWWVTRDRDASPQLADGAVIHAPVRPYKEAPKNPGGKTFAGTGDSSFAVSEGQTRPARLEQASGSKLPGTAAGPSAQASPSGTAAGATAAAAQTSGVGVQVGAFSSEAAAQAAWDRLKQQYEALSGFSHRIVEGRADIGTVYRLQAVAGDKSSANDLCTRLKSAGLACQVKN